jgi:polypyrimidine tract-binding protein 2
MDGSMQPALGADGKKVESQSNVLLGLIENMQYAVTVDVLHTVFSAYGTVQKIAIFEKNGSTQALIQYSGTSDC